MTAKQNPKILCVEVSKHCPTERCDWHREENLHVAPLFLLLAGKWDKLWDLSSTVARLLSFWGRFSGGAWSRSGAGLGGAHLGRD